MFDSVEGDFSVGTLSDPFAPLTVDLPLGQIQPGLGDRLQAMPNDLLTDIANPANNSAS